jgi:endonuclease/exonuclease/phosphatase family metal-dependent hydrolase
VQVRQLLQEVEHMQERHLQRQQQQQPPPAAAADSSSIDASSRAVAPAAVLLCGDFNTTPDSDTVRVSVALAAGSTQVQAVSCLACSAADNTHRRC